MHYFFLEGIELLAGTEVDLANPDLKHAYSVLRLKEGDKIAVADGFGTALSGFITVASSERVRALLDQEIPSNESNLNIYLLQSLAKGEKMDRIIRQTVELGIKKIIPLELMRSVPDLKKKEEKKLIRWQKIARSAAAQSRRAFLPQVEKIKNLKTLLSDIEGQFIVMPWEREEKVSLKELLTTRQPEVHSVSLLIGPEGGFDLAEIEAIRKIGGHTVHMGPRILRTETAAVAAVTMIQSLWGDF